MNEETENNITAQLVGLMKRNPKRSSLRIHLDRENYLDSDEIYAGLENADESPRIDIKYTTWNAKEEVEFFMEAKNLAENDWQKANGATVNAKALRKRYIETGIFNFTSGRYLNGCLIGYVLEGSVMKVANLINQELIQAKRPNETLNKQGSNDGNHYYISNHSGTSINTLKHFFLHLS
ncbi:MAG TPA: hypothetical protein PKA77_12345 [Chitinophagaceae bacterium]|nr:hypothetical protein [Chitinophagaceae bacterium]HMU59050.1 hypothetical protein [Chitinophagaceae bacterium]